MQTRRSTDTIGNTVVAKVELDTGVAEPVTLNEQAKLRQFGQLQVDLGGTLSPGGEIPNLVLPARIVSLPAEFPVQQVFSLGDYPAAAGAYATAWTLLVRDNLSAALTTLLAKQPTSTQATDTLPLS